MTFDQFQKTTYAQALKLTKPVKQRERFLKTIYKDSSEMVNTPGFDIEKLPTELKGMSENCVIK